MATKAEALKNYEVHNSEVPPLWLWRWQRKREAGTTNDYTEKSEQAQVKNKTKGPKRSARKSLLKPKVEMPEPARHHHPLR